MLDCVEVIINRGKFCKGLASVAKKTFDIKGATFLNTNTTNNVFRINFYFADNYKNLVVDCDSYDSTTNELVLNLFVRNSATSEYLITNNVKIDLNNFETYAQIMNYIYDEIDVNKLKTASVKKAYRLPEKVKTFEKNIEKFGLGFDDQSQRFFYYKINPLGFYTTEKSKEFNGTNPFDSLQTAIRSEDHIRESLVEKMKLHRLMLNDIVKYSNNPNSVKLENYINKRVRTEDRKAINEKIETLVSIDKINDEYAYKKAYEALEEAVEKALDTWGKQLKALSGRRRFTMGLSAQIAKNPNFFQELFGFESGQEEKPAADSEMVAKIKKAIISKQTISFMYRKQSGEEREVNLTPKGFTSGSEGMMVAGFDLDRNAARKFFINNIITLK